MGILHDAFESKFPHPLFVGIFEIVFFSMALWPLVKHIIIVEFKKAQVAYLQPGNLVACILVGSFPVNIYGPVLKMQSNLFQWT